jgi:hypothetical protein
MTLASPLEVPVVGVTFRGANYPQNVFAVGKAVALADRPIRANLVREPNNPVDPNAIKVFVGSLHMGYVPADIAADLSSQIDAGENWLAVVDRIIVSPENPDQPGLRLKVLHHDL